MIQEYTKDIWAYIVENRVNVSTSLTLVLAMTIAVYYWIKSEVGVVSRKDLMAMSSVVGILLAPLVLGVVGAAVIIGLIKFYEFIFSLSGV